MHEIKKFSPVLWYIVLLDTAILEITRFGGAKIYIFQQWDSKLSYGDAGSWSPLVWGSRKL